MEAQRGHTQVQQPSQNQNTTTPTTPHPDLQLEAFSDFDLLSQVDLTGDPKLLIVAHAQSSPRHLACAGPSGPMTYISGDHPFSLESLSVLLIPLLGVLLTESRERGWEAGGISPAMGSAWV